MRIAFDFGAVIEPDFEAHPPRTATPLGLKHVIEYLLRGRPAELAKANEILQLAPVPPGELDRTFGLLLFIHTPRFQKELPLSRTDRERQNDWVQG